LIRPVGVGQGYARDSYADVGQEAAEVDEGGWDAVGGRTMGITYARRDARDDCHGGTLFQIGKAEKGNTTCLAPYEEGIHYWLEQNFEDIHATIIAGDSP